MWLLLHRFLVPVAQLRVSENPHGINKSGSIDFAQLQQKLVDQFSGLDPKDPSAWPSIPRYALFLLTAIIVVVALWFLWLSGSDEMLQQEQQKEVTLRADYKTKLTKAVNLDVLKSSVNRCSSM